MAIAGSLSSLYLTHDVRDVLDGVDVLDDIDGCRDVAEMKPTFCFAKSLPSRSFFFFLFFFPSKKSSIYFLRRYFSYQQMR